MRPDQENDPYFPDFQKFVDYYGQPDYADAWITAAFEAESTSFKNGNADFGIWESDYEARAGTYYLCLIEAPPPTTPTTIIPNPVLFYFRLIFWIFRTEAIKKGTAYMSVAMYVIRELEDAIYDCEQGCDRDDCNDDAVQALDEAVAFYAGSLEGTTGDGDGNLIYALADKRAANFRTAGENGNEANGKAKVNYDILRQFSLMQDKLVQKQCDGARTNKERIAELIFVPMVQGTIRYAYIVGSDPEATNKAKAEGATFAASVLPVVHACNANDAKTIYDNMKVGASGTPDLAAVKAAFEKNYDCMRITCADVGGVWDDALGAYESGAEPCGGVGVGSSASGTGGDSVNVGLAVGLTIAGIVLVLLVVLYCKCCRKKNEVEFKSDENNVS